MLPEGLKDHRCTDGSSGVAGVSKNADPSDLLRAKKPATDSAFQSTGETKPSHIHPTDPNVVLTHISTTLDSK